MAFLAGAIKGILTLDRSGWNASVNAVKKDTQALGGFIERNSDKFKSMGKTMTVAGAAITGAIGLIVKQASNAQEITSKFGVIFQSVMPEAAASVKNLSENYGLSTIAAKEMLGATGDLLTGLGVSAGEALKLSSQTQQLAVDLASFTNYSGGAKGASEALTKAMLGERESIKALGIVVTEEMVKEKLLIMGKEKLTGLALKQAAAEATLMIAMEQSKNAIGDYARTSTSLANVSRELQARIQELFVEIGTTLIPIVTKFANKAKEVVVKITDWVKEHPKLTEWIAKTALKVGVLLTALGPILIMLPKIVAGFKTIQKLKLSNALANQFKSLNTDISGLSGALGKLPAIGAAAFVGWKIGRLIGEVTGLDDVLKKTFERIFMGKKLMEEDIPMASQAGADAMSKLRTEYGLTGVQLVQLVKKYGDYSAALKAVEDGLEATIKKKKTAAETINQKLAPAVKAITEMSTKMTDEVKKATLDEFKYRVWAAEQTFIERKKTLEKEGAAKGEFVLAEKAYAVELKTIEEDRAKKEDEIRKKGYERWLEIIKEKKEKQKEYQGFVQQFTDKIKQFTLDEFDYKQYLAKKDYENDLQILKDKYGDSVEFYKLKRLLDASYFETKINIEKERHEKEKELELAALKRNKEILEERLKHWLNFASNTANAMGTFLEDVLNETILFRNAEFKELQTWYEREKKILRDKYGDSKEYQENLAKLNAEYAEKNRELEERKANWFKERMKILWGDIKAGFAQMIGDMVKEFLTNFVKNIIMGAAQVKPVMTETGGVFKELGKTVKGIGEGIASLITSLSKALADSLVYLAEGIAKAAKALAKAAPELLIVAGIAVATFAAFKAVGALFDGGGKRQRQANELIQELRDKTFEIYNMLKGSFEPILTKDLPNIIMDGNTVVGWILNATEGILGYVTAIKDYCGEIESNTSGMLKILSNLPTSQKGGYFKEPALTWVAEKRIPEIVAPAKEVKSALQVAATGGEKGGGRPVQITVEVSNKYDIKTLDTVTMRDLVRKEIEPQIIDSIQASIHKTKWKEALGL